MEIAGVEGFVIEGNFDWPIIAVQTDSGLTGYGEIRDHIPGGTAHAETRYVQDPLQLVTDLEDHLRGKDPRNVVAVFETIRSFGGAGRQGGGVSAIEMACWDLLGKYTEQPVWRLLGGSARNSIPIYCDCRAGNPIVRAPDDYSLTGNEYAPEDYADHAVAVAEQGFEFLKFDLNPRATKVVRNETGIRNGRITDAGIDYIENVTAAIREALPSGVDFAYDCAAMTNISVADCIRAAQTLEPYHISCLEDLRTHKQSDAWRQITNSTSIPTITGEDGYLLDDFQALITREAVDLVGPDLLSAGGIRPTIEIARAAHAHGIGTNLHFAGSPVGFLASVMAASQIEALHGLEFHAIGVPWWGDLVDTGDVLIEDGQSPLPDRPGLGFDWNESVVRDHLRSGDSLPENGL